MCILIDGECHGLGCFSFLAVDEIGSFGFTFLYLYQFCSSSLSLSLLCLSCDLQREVLGMEGLLNFSGGFTSVIAV